MVHVVEPILKVFLQWLGVDEKQEFVWMVLFLFALFLSYAGWQWRDPQQRVYSFLYLIGALGALIFLFSTSSRGRRVGAVGFVAAVVLLFAWYFAHRAAQRDGGGS